MSPFLASLLLVGLGGAAGGVARIWVSSVVTRRFGEAFPWGILVVNVSGAAAIGCFAALLLSRDTHVADTFQLWAGLVIGVLGSYTTVSSFSLQTLALARSGEVFRAALNVTASVTLCLLAAALGDVATRAFLGGA